MASCKNRYPGPLAGSISAGSNENPNAIALRVDAWFAVLCLNAIWNRALANTPLRWLRPPPQKQTCDVGHRTDNLVGILDSFRTEDLQLAGLL